MDAGCRTAGIGCIDCKKQLMTGITAHLTPIQERAETLKADPDFVRDALAQGRARPARSRSRSWRKCARKSAS